MFSSFTNSIPACSLMVSNTFQSMTWVFLSLVQLKHHVNLHHFDLTLRGCHKSVLWVISVSGFTTVWLMDRK